MYFWPKTLVSTEIIKIHPLVSDFGNYNREQNILEKVVSENRTFSFQPVSIWKGLKGCLLNTFFFFHFLLLLGNRNSLNIIQKNLREK